MPMDYAVLWGAGLEVPATLCQYLDNSDPQYPARECPLEVGHTYQVEIVTACGLDGPLSSPMGGVYWEPLAVVGDFHGPLQYGTLELTSPDEAVFISEFGSVLELGRTEAAAMGPCPVFPGQ